MSDPIVENSAGGVLLRTDEEQTQVCLIKVNTRGGNPSWRLPKGSLEISETFEEAAVRETREETGCSGEIISQLSEIDYWYTRSDDGERVRVKKVVNFFLMHYTHGDVEDHDHEVEEAKWFTLKDALRTISYDAEGRVLQEAIHSWDAHLYRQGLL